MTQSAANALALPFRLGLFYGSSTRYTEFAAEKIRDCFGVDEHHTYWVELHDIATTGLLEAANYQGLILGIPTWDYGELQEDWDRVWDQLDAINFADKVVALYGMGDQQGYPDWFQDAMGYLFHKLDAAGARVIGFWPSAGYRFNSSMALTPDKHFFVGLALDEENEFNRTDERIQTWCRQLREELNTL